MKPGAIFINTSRAGLVEPGALEAALRAGRPGRAGVDVFEVEPVVGGDHPLLRLPNVVATPHIGYLTREDFNGIFTDVFNQLNAFADGKPVFVVNPQALGKR
jgi:D-3-phosphoglycerate dehydrogenase